MNKTLAWIFIAMGFASLCSVSADQPSAAPDSVKVCAACEAWNLPHEPFQVFGNTYYVGVAGLSAILITSKDGLILLDGALPQSVPFIVENIRKLGFRAEDIRLIVNSHTHFDHAGGIAALQRISGATVAASPEGKRALEKGEPTEDDPQYSFGHESTWFPPVPNARSIADNEVLRVGNLTVTAHFTPGHTPGSTTWTWRSCEGKRCLDIVYADSLNSVSAPGFRFTGDGAGKSRVDAFRHSIAVVQALPCDVLLSPHPDFFGMDAKLKRRHEQPQVNPFIDAQACKAYAVDAMRKLDQRIADENATLER